MVAINYGALTSDPSAFLDLLNDALVLTGWLANSTVYGRPQLLKLEPVTTFSAFRKRRARRNKQMAVLKLVHAGGGAGFRGYVLDYADNSISYQILDREASYCFTVTMNGCTFGVGSPTPDGSVLVTHCNAKKENEGGQLAGSQQNRQRMLAQAFHGPNAGLFEPSSYRTNRENATTFGVRVNGEWEFYYQSYTFVGGMRYRVHGTKAVKVTRIGF